MCSNELINLASDLISIPSVSGTEKKLVDYLSALFSSYGFKTEIMPSGSIVAIIEGDAPGPTIVMDGHIDTVTVPDISLWHTDPYRATVKDGRLYGRGASDMKASCASMIMAFREFSSRPFNGRLILACIVEEERFEGVASREISDRFNPDYVIIGEAPHGRLNLGQRGRAEVLVSTFGKSCHSSNPEEGVNAIRKMLDVMKVIDTLPIKHDEYLSDAIMEPTDIISKPYPGASVIPEGCYVTYDRRTLVGESMDDITRPIEDALKEHGVDARVEIALGTTTSYSGSKLEAYRFFPAWRVDESSDIAKKAIKGLKDASLFEGVGYYHFCTNGSHYAGEKNIPTIGYGPGEERLAHIVDEYVTIADLEKCQKGFVAILNGLFERIL